MPQNRPGWAASNACPDKLLADGAVPPNHVPMFNELPVPLSPGDQLDVRVHNDAALSGSFSVNMDGTLTIPFLKDIPVLGLTAEQAEAKVAKALTSAGLYRASTVRVSVKLKHWATIQVSVAGAVFQPGRSLVGDRKPDGSVDQDLGDSTPGRYLSYAIKGAGGVRPDADLGKVRLTRSGTTRVLDLTGIFTGSAMEDPPIMQGDQVFVPSSGCIHSDLVRPSQITPPGIRVFLSNLTQPAASNAQSAISTQATNVPYGTRLLHGAISANCVGGIRLTNASRSVVLATTNPITRQTEVIERSVEELVRSKDRDLINPYLLPGDGIACYDSAVTNGRDVMRSLLETVVPIPVVRSVTGW
ncbi:polysaccharide export protein (plasmid) [Azospirillum argentinense]|uniref:Polysaccharide export protein n=2 Tax=Azospirillum argentinense TaxID=2970906 RepID=A0A4D8PLK9_9PROT|nr:polysaccharide export protein [Azospirillum argentinense]